MARKNLLKDLIDAPRTTPDPAASPVPPRPMKGAIGAVSQSIAELKTRAVIDLDPGLVDPGGLADRMEHDAEDHARLVASLKAYGQQVPVLVRPHPETPGRYQIVYGRRRLRALTELGLTVRAMVRELDDKDVILAQGQENTARRDLSFIEKVHFARQMHEAGYGREVIADALHVDRTVVSKMMTVAHRIPEEVIRAIGAAPSVGRDRWVRLAAAIEDQEATPGEVVALAAGETSDARFEALMRALTIGARRARAGRAAMQAEVPGDPVLAEDGTTLAEVRRKGGTTALKLAAEPGFQDWLVAELPRLHQRWKSGG